MPYSSLFQTYRFTRGVEARNRLVMAPMTTWSSHDNGLVHDDELRYLGRRSRAVGMTITAACYVQRSGKAFPGQWGCDDDTTLSSLQAVADVIHECGALAVLQLHHGGRMCPASLLPDGRPLSASAVAAIRDGADIPVEMRHEEILATIEAFASATRRAIDTGYDGVEIHGANTYLVQQFFSPHSNRRQDEWGGDIERRMRFPLAVADAVFEEASRAGRPFLVGYRVSPEEIEVPGITIDETLLLVDALASTSLSWLHVSVRDYRAAPLRADSGTGRPTRRIIEKVADRLPVIGVGMVHAAEDAEFMRRDGCFFVALGRILLMEPEWVQRLLEDKPDELRQTLPISGGDATLDIPAPMYRMLLSRPGWLPVR